MKLHKILRPVTYLSVFGGVSGALPNSRKYRLLLIIVYSIMTALNFAHLLFTPFGVIYMEKILNATHEALTSQHFVIKVMNPVLVSAVSLYSRLSILYQIYHKSSAVLTLLEKVDALLGPAHLTESTTAIKIFCLLTLLISFPFQIVSYVRLTITSTAVITQFAIFFLNIYNNFSAACCELQFIAITWLVFARFRLVHKNLKKIGNALERSLKREGVKENKASQVERRGEDLSAKIAVLKECRHILCDVSDRLNRIYNGQLFVSLSSLFVNVLLNLYFAIFGGFAQPATQHVHAQMLQSVVNSLTWSLYYFLRFTFICATADALVNEGNSTRVFISNLMRHHVENNTKELWTFLTLVVARKIKITAYGFFSVNLRLVTTAVATGSTYLVVLAQLHKG